ncbi:hypothetical protein ACFFVB_11195 [Formosa undariae]|uniref:DUF4412 domain-containing protein n=1 Tax=Formosa undariae TaxID=1325436 RepID=A0ABV5F2G8_9FLAO
MKSIVCLIILSFYTFSATAYAEDGIIKSDTIVGSSEQVDYKVTQHQGNLTLQLSTRDNKTMMSMLRHGVTVFFDLKGKEKEDVAVTYPIQPIQMSMKPEGGREVGFQSEAEINQMKTQINTLVTTDFPEEALLKLYDSKENFNVLLNGMGISATYFYNQKENLLTYQLTIPQNKIKEKSKNDFSKLMIGVQTAKPDKSKRSEGSEDLNSSMSSRGGGNRQGGSGGRGGGRGGSRDGGQRPGGDAEKAPQGIDFWFEAHL